MLPKPLLEEQQAAVTLRDLMAAGYALDEAKEAVGFSLDALKTEMSAAGEEAAKETKLELFTFDVKETAKTSSQLEQSEGLLKTQENPIIIDPIQATAQNE
ncbi:hypothetical protein GOP47_0025978 [Adiantum capillus-veneris]|uniref:Uncharacterized protein n=1 Tax=Adiantum capillus-veneris TaxID=13818 RepID=A0A9D4U194_ADICA|nr:hypothetical protein GOP47_0025978 [Adiantum capillus-veneris]